MEHAQHGGGARAGHRDPGAFVVTVLTIAAMVIACYDLLLLAAASAH
ncbi:MAG TPA: hypothetical protein VJ814_10460 [Gaiellaceae bacterium]|nr:hypothetical protein [Gaiellaceae bacterium]